MLCVKRILSRLSFLLVLVAVLSSCSAHPGAHFGMASFAEVLGGGVVYSPEIKEGEQGYIDGDFFALMFGEYYSFDGDYAVWLSSSLSSAEEGGAFFCDSSYSARIAAEMLLERIELVENLSSAASLDVQESFVMQLGSAVVYYYGANAELARRTYKEIF